MEHGKDLVSRRYPLGTQDNNISREMIDKYKTDPILATRQLRSCGYECMGGTLENNVAFIAIEELIKERGNRMIENSQAIESEQYMSVKMIKAVPMDKYVFYMNIKGIDCKEDNEEGYMVIYPDGYQSWSPKKAFDESSKRIDNLTFGFAVEATKLGYKVYRDGWNGRGMFVVYQKGYPDGISCNVQTAKAWGMYEGEPFRCEPYLQIKMTNGSHSMWVPSINDVLADDWHIVID